MDFTTLRERGSLQYPNLIVDSSRRRRCREERLGLRSTVCGQFLPRTSGTSRIRRSRCAGELIRFAAIECVAVVEQPEPWLNAATHPFVTRARWSFGPVLPFGPLPAREKRRRAIPL